MSDLPDGAAPGDLTSLHIRRAARGVRESQQWLVARFSGLLLGLADLRLPASVRREIDPEDVVNDVWLRALDRIPTLAARPGERMGPTLLRYLSRILVNRVLRILERHQRKIEHPPPSHVPDTDWLRRIVHREIRTEVWQAIRSLDDLSLRILILHALEGRTYDWIAVQESMTPGAVRERYRASIALLRMRLPDSIFDELAAIAT